jgi:hypothetical protein
MKERYLLCSPETAHFRLPMKNPFGPQIPYNIWDLSKSNFEKTEETWIKKFSHQNNLKPLRSNFALYGKLKFPW